MIAGVVPAAGAGTRMMPLTRQLPKALCPVGGVPLAELALGNVTPHAGQGPEHVAVNAHHHAEAVAARFRGRATVSREEPEALGTAGALGALKGWIDGRDVLVANADAYLPGGLAPLLQGWDGERMRLLCVPAGARRQDFTTPDGRAAAYVGACLLPWSAVRGLEASPTGLYEVLWRAAAARDELDLVLLDATAVAIDCGTPADYLAANLHATGGASSVAPDAVVEGTLSRCVVWPGAWVGPQERLRDAVRAGTREQPVTVFAPAVTVTAPNG